VIIAKYPEFSEMSMGMRPVLHPRFQTLSDGISELTFANIYLFRDTHKYMISQLDDDLFIITGRDNEEPFFILPFGLPDETVTKEIFDKYKVMKCVSQSQVEILTALNYFVYEDRDNFDYLYSRADMTNLTGRKFHKKKNLLNMFIKNNECQAKPLLEEYRDDALQILEQWNTQHNPPNDYSAAKEALEKMWPLQLCGGIFYIDAGPVAYCLGEELAHGSSFVIHFEKAVLKEEFKGIYQFINQAFASILPDKYKAINREQDLGDPGLRHSKESYHPIDFVKKYKAKISQVGTKELRFLEKT
jgi:hypothetical protein